ncbi:MAG: isoleucine--tRNA ligase [Bacteroidales bacterium]|nr:isoleucine--tRNA ligase [Bacteroidales bacterium]
MKHFNEYHQFDLSLISREMLADWEKEHLFEQSVKTRAGQPKFLFFEGPPSANGMPGIHHVLSRTIKDTFCRYKTMQGFEVQRKAGWDTHGLPVELGVEKMLGITKEDIGKKISVDEYNAACRKEVMKYTKEWTNLTKQMGYWVDLDDPYITYDNKYIETLWYLLKELYKKGYLYKGYTIQPYSPAAGTGLSSHELNQPGCYRDVKDTTCTVQFLIRSQEPGQKTKDTSVPAVFSIAEREGLPIYALAWTTTPWTLPSNTALCVGEKIEYCFVKSANPYSGQEGIYIIAKALVNNYFTTEADENTQKQNKPQAVILGECTGKELVGLSYEQLIPWAKPKAEPTETNAFHIIPGDYVTTEDGTGIVHIAPTFGADDAFVAKKANVPAMIFLTKKGEKRPMVDMTGKFFLLEDIDEDFAREYIDTEKYAQWQGRYVKNAYDATLTDKDETLDIAICMALKADGRAFRIEKHVHNYPHCWRTDKPIIYYPLDSWFIKSTAARDEMIRLNNTIRWQPESTGTGRFGKWLENLNDWNLSRSRYWGTPLPIWRTEDGQEEICIGSVKELIEEIEKSIAAGYMTENPYKNFVAGDYSKENYAPENIDLHRPYVDNIVLVSQSGKPMKRESDLIDVWFDSGAMPYAQIHYPFENQDAPRTADFICEGVDQTRGWFFTLHAIHTMIEDKVAYKNVISNGLVLDKNGNKMSKRLGNAVDPFQALNQYGSDPVRWYMLTNSSPWENLKFDQEGVEEVRRKFFGTLYNTYSFFALYANVDGFTGEEKAIDIADRPEIDRWILSLLNTLTEDVTGYYETYEPTRAGRAISDFVQENLSNWYVRLNRKRFWGGEMNEDKLAAYQTLYTCLKTVAQLMAPIAPFYADRLYRDLVSEKESVHLSRFPKADEQLIDKHLESCMQLAQQASSMILALRRRAEKKVRQPLQKAVIPAADQQTLENLQYVAELIKNEVNVKELQIVSKENSEVQLVKKIKPNFKTLGKKYGKLMKELAAAITAMPQADISAFEQKGTWQLPLSETVADIDLTDVEIITEDMPGWLVANDGSLTIALDIEVTEELIEEGIARELINRIQNIRKSSNFEITDKILIQIEQNAATDKAVEHFREYISSQVLAQQLDIVPQLTEAQDLDFEDFIVHINIKKA